MPAISNDIYTIVFVYIQKQQEKEKERTKSNHLLDEDIKMRSFFATETKNKAACFFFLLFLSYSAVEKREKERHTNGKINTAHRKNERRQLCSFRINRRLQVVCFQFLLSH